MGLNAPDANAPNPSFSFQDVAASDALWAEATGSITSTNSRILVKEAKDDPRMQFAVRAIENKGFSFDRVLLKLSDWLGLHKFVKLEGADKPIYINLNSLAKRIILSDMQKNAILAKGTISQEEINTQLTKLDAAKQQVTDMEAKHRGGANMSFAVFKAFDYMGQAWREHFASSEPHKGVLVKHKDYHHYEGTYRTAIKEGKMHVILIDKGKRTAGKEIGILGHGGMATAYKVHDLTTNTFKVFKQFHKTEEDMSQKVEHAVTTMTGAGKGVAGHVEGVVKAPSLAFADGYVMDLYEGDLNDWVDSQWEKNDAKPKDPDKLFSCCAKIAVALQNFRGIDGIRPDGTAGYRHGDIKPGNILFDHDENGTEFSIGDVDDTYKILQDPSEVNDDNVQLLVTTPNYISQKDREDIRQATVKILTAAQNLEAVTKQLNNDPVENAVVLRSIADKLKNRIQKGLKTLIKSTEKHDVLSMAITQFEVLTHGKSPFDLKLVKMDIPLTHEVNKQQIKVTYDRKILSDYLDKFPAGVDKERILRFFDKALALDPEDRCNLKEFVEESQAIFGEEIPPPPPPLEEDEDPPPPPYQPMEI